MADCNVNEIERIKRTYYGLTGAGKVNFGKMQSTYEKLQEGGLSLKDADTDGCTYKSFTYALNTVMGQTTDPGIRKFQKKKQNKKKAQRDISKSKTVLRQLDVKNAYNYRWQGYGWVDMLKSENKRHCKLVLSWGVGYFSKQNVVVNE